MDRVQRLSAGPRHHFFGYYGISPWNETGTHHLALETDFHEHRPAADDVAGVGLIDAVGGAFEPFAETGAFNLQQGSMLHWIDAGFGEEFTYNDWSGEKGLISRAANPQTGDTRTLDGAIAAVSPTEPVAIGLNFVRMASCRAVVGYAVGSDARSQVARPEDDGLYRIDLRTGKSELILSIADVAARSKVQAPEDTSAWFNHVVINPSGERLFFFCRVRTGEWWLSSLWVCGMNGEDLQCQIDFGHLISHFDWLDDDQIVISTSVLDEKMQFVIFTVGERNFRPFGAGQLPRDGHLCFSPDRRWAVCDSYPRGENRFAELMLYNLEERRKIPIGQFDQPEPFRGDIRCDLHPRWRPDGTAVTFDSIHESSRQVYIADVADLVGT